MCISILTRGSPFYFNICILPAMDEHAAADDAGDAAAATTTCGT